ncbi:hypothetical protein DAI22_01g057208 [Oryza sativa Japonica Group]|nr:hypothetical protein DAI22_01g057208 [Oryza sativa Japonica Group]
MIHLSKTCIKHLICYLCYNLTNWPLVRWHTSPVYIQSTVQLVVNRLKRHTTKVHCIGAGLASQIAGTMGHLARLDICSLKERYGCSAKIQYLIRRW